MRTAEPTWTGMRMSLDIVLARAIECGATVAVPSTCNEEAFKLARKLDPSVDPASLVAALENATSNYDSASWGYETSSDGSAVVAQLRSAASKQPSGSPVPR